MSPVARRGTALAVAAALSGMVAIHPSPAAAHRPAAAAPVAAPLWSGTITFVDHFRSDNPLGQGPASDKTDQTQNGTVTIKDNQVISETVQDRYHYVRGPSPCRVPWFDRTVQGDYNGSGGIFGVSMGRVNGRYVYSISFPYPTVPATVIDVTTDQRCHRTTKHWSSNAFYYPYPYPPVQGQMAPHASLISGSVNGSRSQGIGPGSGIGHATVTWRLSRGQFVPLRITRLKLYDRDLHPDTNPEYTPLKYLSLSPHPYNCVHASLTGYTCVWGTITVQGGKTDEIDSLELQVLDGDTVLAEMELGPDAKNKLLHKPFGAAKKLAITTEQLLFRLASPQMSGIDQTQDVTLTLRAKAISKDGQEAEAVAQVGGTVKKLVLYTGTNRYGPRDEDQGGDGWVRPSVATVLKHFASGHCYGDMSNMNGGHFSGHQTHQDGIDVDVNFDSPHPCGPNHIHHFHWRFVVENHPGACPGDPGVPQ